MTPFEWLSVGVGVVSVLGVWLTGIAWWHGRATNKLITSSAEGTQALSTTTTTNTQTILERMDQQANQRQREMMEAIQALKR
jgi:tellurite resistance protein